MYETNITILRDRHRDQILHKLRIKKIQKLVDNNLPQSYQKNIPRYKSPVSPIYTQAPKQNDILLKKLQKIMREESFSRSLSSCRRSLNASQRRKEAFRIKDQNQQFLKKLEKMQSQLSVQRFNHSYNSQKELKFRISRTQRELNAKKMACRQMLPIIKKNLTVKSKIKLPLADSIHFARNIQN